MKRSDKDQLIEELSAAIKASSNIYITDISSLTVEKTSQLRRVCFSKGISLKVAKNTLIRKAMERSGNDYSQLFDVLKGSSSLMFCDVANAPAKVIKDFRKTSDRPILKGAFVESSFFIGDTNVAVLAGLKSKNELIGDIIAILQSPAKNVIGALQSSGGKIAGLVKTLSERKEG